MRILHLLIVLLTLAPHARTAESGTLDLRKSVEMAVRSLNARLDEGEKFLPYCTITDVRSTAPKMVHGSSTRTYGLAGRCLDALISRRAVWAGRIGSDRQSQLAQILVNYQLGYAERKVADPEDQAGILQGMVALYRENRDTKLKSSVNSLIKDAAELFSGGPVRDKSADLTSNICHWGSFLTPLVEYYEMTGDKPSLAFAEKITRHILTKDKTIRPDGGFSVTGREQTRTDLWARTLVGMIRCADTSKSVKAKDVQDFASSIYNYWRQNGIVTHQGWVADYSGARTCSACSTSAVIELALALADRGPKSFYNDVERFVRSHFITSQITSCNWVTGAESERTARMLIGAFDSASLTNELLTGDLHTCCTVSALKALCRVWSSAVTTDKADEVWVNLLTSVNDGTAEIKSYLPDEGKVEITPHLDCKLRIRVPNWADQAKLARSGKGKPGLWENGYLYVNDAKKDETFTLTMSVGHDISSVSVGKETFMLNWAGDTVVSVSPPGRFYPAYPVK